MLPQLQKKHHQRSATKPFKTKNYNHHTMIKNIFFAIFFLASFTAFAQRDTTKKQSIDITSSYKPVLRNSVKINFAGSQLAADTARPVLNYNIPSQNLFYAYRPISLKPLALEQDTNIYLGNRNFVKAGFGNLSTPYIAAGLSFGDGKTSLVNLTGDYIQSKGKIKNQDYSLLNVKASGSYFMRKNELYGGVEVNSHLYSLYGYNHFIHDYDKKDVRQQFQNVSVNAGFKNTVTNELGVNYNSSIRVGFFSNKDLATETNVFVDVPVEKPINDNFTVKAELKADLTSYQTKNFIPNNFKVDNNLVQVTPSINYKTDIIKFHGGITPVWNNGEFELLPDVYAEAQVKDRSFAVQAGWIGRFTKNSYKNLTDINPYLAPVFTQINTKETEYYGGIKASLAKHFNVSAKAGLVNYANLPFFINDTTGDGKSFVISNEKRVNNFRVHGDLSYINQDKFTLTAGATFNGYTSMKTNAKAWHTLPVEITGSLRWWAYKTVLIKADAYIFEGSNYLAKGPTAMGFKGGTDVSAGVEIKINKKFSIWADANNLLNSKYERWHNYEVYGTNFMGGIIARF